MRFYKLNGVWQSWDYLHNELGYAEHATRPTVFKSCADATWGEDAGNGYYDGDVNDMINGTFWTDADPTGWFSLDGLVWNSETYPADATPSLLVKDGVASDALVITCDDGNYYLIRAIIDTTAWIPESEVGELGWRSPSFVVVDSTTGKVASGCNQELTTYELPSVVLNSEDGYETYELPSVSLPTPNVVIGIPISGPVQAFWFSDKGRDETENRQFNLGNPLYTESGERASRDVYGDYIGAVPLSFMEYDGDMFLPDPDADNNYVRHVNNTLNLTIRNAASIRSKSAWSVQFAKLFVLSYANTQLPDVQIELPINEVGAYGTQITLPTIDGEYESGGKTWKPSAWDIGAFGSSYSLTGDVVAHLVFEEVQQYEEITLYMASGNKQAQSGVTSSFTGNVNSTYCYPLYTDAECTTPWTGYDYSNDYELGRYVDGVWTPYIRQNIAGMPASTTGNFDYVFGRILLDTGELWHVTNYQLVGTTSNLNPIIRIYPKAQQHYAGYLAYNNAYNDTTITTATKGFYPKPTNDSQTNTSGWFKTFPKATITRLLMSAGNEAQSVLGDEIASSTNYRMIFRQASAMSRTFRAIEYTLDRPTLHAWLKTDHTNKSTTAAALNNLYDDDGNLLMFDGNTSAVYVPIGVYTSTGANCNNNMNTLERSKFGSRSSGEWCFIQNYASVSIARVWYVKYTDCKVAYFNANKTNYTWTQGTTRVLYDADGNRIPYDSTKTYTIIQLRESSHSVITPTFGDLALKSLINNAGNLACNAASGGTYSSLSVASVWYLEE